jgi:phosphoribosylaminoimidazole carboxylase PurE protein
MNAGIAIIIMGGKVDLDHARKIADALASFGVASVMRIASAHKTPARLLSMLEDYEKDPVPKVYITIAGLSNGLSGLVDAAVGRPVIACPPSSDKFAGADIYSSLRMPPGVAPAVVLDPVNAALFAAKILGTCNAEIREMISKFQYAQKETIASDDGALPK